MNFFFFPFSPPVQAGCGALRVEQAPERQVHGSHGAPLLEHGAQHQSVRPQAVRDDQVSRRVRSLVCSGSYEPDVNLSDASPQVLSAADVEAVPVGEGGPGVGGQGDGAEAEDPGRAGPLLHHLRGR